MLRALLLLVLLGCSGPRSGTDASSDGASSDGASSEDGGGEADAGTADSGEPDATADASADGGAVDGGVIGMGRIAIGSGGSGCVARPPAPTRCWSSTGVTSIRSSSDFVDVAMAGSMACAWTSSGALWCWGRSFPWPEAPMVAADPFLVTSLEGVLDVDMRESERHGCALVAGGTLSCWLPGGTAARGDGLTGVESVSVVAQRACAVMEDHTARCWGGGGGNGDGTTEHGDTPRVVAGLTDAIEIAAGWYISCARTAPGEIWCWGEGTGVGVGDGEPVPRLAPVRVDGVEAPRAIAAAWSDVCAIAGDRTVWCWGASIGAARYESPTPTPIAGIADAHAIAKAQDHTCVLRVDGSVVCWYWGEPPFEVSGL